MTVREAAEREIGKMRPEIRDSALAAALLRASEVYDHKPTAFLLKEIREAWQVLHAESPPVTERDRIDELSSRRRARRA